MKFCIGGKKGLRKLKVNNTKLFLKTACMDFTNLFPDNREKGDTRIRQCQLVMTRMLKILDYLCNKYQIDYFLTGGTLIGAVRHRGFIPWDDDLDIGMTRGNYEKFIKYVVPELPNDIFFQNDETDIYYPACKHTEARLRDKYSSYKSLKKNKWHEGLAVDIFVYDRSFVPHNFFIIIQNKLLKILNSNRKRALILNWISKHAPCSLVYASSFIQSFKGLQGTYVKQREINQLLRVKFEDVMAWIPEGWDTYLKRQYGDYMKLPPIQKQQGLHSKDLPDPFMPCNHREILYWKDKERVCVSN